MSNLTTETPNRHRAVFERATSLAMLRRGFEKVRHNSGAAGGDGMPVRVFEFGLDVRLQTLFLKLRNGTYVPKEVRAVDIPQSGGKGTGCTSLRWLIAWRKPPPIWSCATFSNLNLKPIPMPIIRADRSTWRLMPFALFTLRGMSGWWMRTSRPVSRMFPIRGLCPHWPNMLRKVIFWPGPAVAGNLAPPRAGPSPGRAHIADPGQSLS